MTINLADLSDELSLHASRYSHTGLHAYNIILIIILIMTLAEVCPFCQTFRSLSCDPLQWKVQKNKGKAAAMYLYTSNSEMQIISSNFGYCQYNNHEYGCSWPTQSILRLTWVIYYECILIKLIIDR